MERGYPSSVTVELDTFVKTLGPFGIIGPGQGVSGACRFRRVGTRGHATTAAAARARVAGPGAYMPA